MRAVCEKYGISYICVGRCEREKYPMLDEEALRAFGEVVFEYGNSFLVRVGVG